MDTVDIQSPSIWGWLALPDRDLEQSDLAAANLCVARGIPALGDLDVCSRCRTVDDWTQQFVTDLPRMEQVFHRGPSRYKSDIRFFRVGMLAGFLGSKLGIRYIESQKSAASVSYTNPSDLFLDGVIDTRRGTCGNMAALHVAMSRRIGWPVSLAVVSSHIISRYDDGSAVHNVELSSVNDGTFASDDDAFYKQKFGLPERAVECGSDLRRLTVREMLGVFIALPARHFADVGDSGRADTDYALSRVCFPQYRRGYIGSMVPMLRRGASLFDHGETGHPDSVFRDFGQIFDTHGRLPAYRDVNPVSAGRA
jgi:hypothetical protein